MGVTLAKSINLRINTKISELNLFKTLPKTQRMKMRWHYCCYCSGTFYCQGGFEKMSKGANPGEIQRSVMFAVDAVIAERDIVQHLLRLQTKPPSWG